jgi:hypothetical protein
VYRYVSRRQPHSAATLAEQSDAFLRVDETKAFRDMRSKYPIEPIEYSEMWQLSLYCTVYTKVVKSLRLNLDRALALEYCRIELPNTHNLPVAADHSYRGDIDKEKP